LALALVQERVIWFKDIATEGTADIAKPIAKMPELKSIHILLDISSRYLACYLN
jgi:hypothetical protein